MLIITRIDIEIQIFIDNKGCAYLSIAGAEYCACKPAKDCTGILILVTSSYVGHA